jgi:hypothetical protein
VAQKIPAYTPFPGAQKTRVEFIIGNINLLEQKEQEDIRSISAQGDQKMVLSKKQVEYIANLGEKVKAILQAKETLAQQGGSKVAAGKN